MVNSRPYEINRDILSPNRNISPITSEVNSLGQLEVGGCLLDDLAKKYGTPLYVIDEATIRASCRAYVTALSNYYQGDYFPLYASKANSSLAISSIILSEGMGLDAVSEGELITALRGGIQGENIVLHGNNKSDNELLLACQNRVTIVIDNKHDIERLNQIVNTEMGDINLMVRFTPGIECHTHEYIRTGHLDSKFGFDLEQLESTLIDLKQISWAKVTGLHAHIGSQIFEINPHIDLSEVMAGALELARKIGHPVTDLNVGGGLGVKYVTSDEPPSIDTWIKAVSQSVTRECLSRNLDLPRLICEPGRSIVANSGLTL